MITSAIVVVANTRPKLAINIALRSGPIVEIILEIIIANVVARLTPAGVFDSKLICRFTKLPCVRIRREHKIKPSNPNASVHNKDVIRKRTPITCNTISTNKRLRDVLIPYGIDK